MTRDDTSIDRNGLSALVHAGIERLRAKLLDLSMANRLLNFKHSDKSRNHVRVIEEIPEFLFEKLDEGKALAFNWIEEPDFEPPEERTAEFVRVFKLAKESDETYLEQIEKLGNRPTRRRIAKLERDLRDRVRASLGLPVRTKPTPAERARELGLNPSYDLQEKPLTPTRLQTDLKIQTLLYREGMDSKLAAIRETDKTLLDDAGINALYAAFGFVEWYESADSDLAAFAPLVFLPVEIQRTLEDGLYKYVLAPRDDDIETNQAFAELIKATVGLELPPWDPDANLTDYFGKIQKLLESQRRWRFHRWVTVGLFTFAKLAMYRDLDPKRWVNTIALENHPILDDLLAGRESAPEVTLAADYEIDSPHISSKSHCLVTDADSSQHSAVIDVLEGKSLVIQGPPGTGKSQTITNIIASAMYNRKRVLFISEKMAALKVVKDKLDNFGLGHFCLEVHSNKTRKTAVIKSLEERLNFSGPPFDGSKLRQLLQAHEQARDELIYYVAKMKEQVGETGLCVFEILRGNSIRTGLADRLPTALRKARIAEPFRVTEFLRDELKELSRDLQARASAINRWQTLSNHPWRGIQNDTLDIFQSEELLSSLEHWNESLETLKSRIHSASAETGWRIEPSSRASADYVNKIKGLPAVPEKLLDEVLRSTRKAPQPTLLPDALAQIERLREVRREIGQVLADVDASIEFGDERLRELTERSRALGLWSLTLPAIEKRNEERHQIAEMAEKAVSAGFHLADRLGVSNPRISDLQSMARAITLLKQIPQKTLGFRDPLVIAEGNLDTLERGAQETDSLLKSKASISAEFQLSPVPSLTEISRASNLLLTSGFLRTLLSSECRAAKALYKNLTADRARRKPKNPGQALASLAEFLQQKLNLEADRKLRLVAGVFYRGMDTQWRELIAVSRWATEVRQTFPSQAATKNPLSEVLLRGDLPRTDAILAFAQAPEYDLMLQLLSVPDIPPEMPLADAIAATKSAAARTEEIVSKLRKLRANPNATIADLCAATDKLVEAKGLIQSLSSPEVAQILGSAGTLWIEKIDALRDTLQFFNALVERDLPEVFWETIRNQSIHGSVEQLARHSDALNDALSAVGEHQDNIQTLGHLNAKLWSGSSDLADIPTNHLQDRIDRALNNKDALQPYLDFLRIERNARSSSMGPILPHVQDAPTPYEQLWEAYEFILYRTCAETLLAENPKLSSHSGMSHDQLRRKYQQLDRKILELRRQEIAQSLLSRPVPAGVGRGRASEFTELALVRRQIGLQRRHVALRELFRRAGNAIQGLKPCFMMSPMSVAQFLDPAGLRFDLVVMDEASQIRPEDAIGAIARGTQVVVVGDPQQLPPTPFFEKVDRDEVMEEDSDEADVQDLTSQESILDLARGPYQPVRQLRWHYRSQHESLIAFSNREFYQNSLIVFPSPFGTHAEYGVRSIEIDGIYESSLNQREAEAVVSATQEFMRNFRDRSLGIVAMNKPQQELIQRMMDDLFATDVEAEAYRIRWENTLDSFFVKNLENVQGDERDVIFISTVYGKDAAGNFFQRLGPINGAHGHRRLNVLFTRAKQQVCLFTSMKSSDLRIEATTRWGVKALKNYLAYAKDGHLERAEITNREPDSEFERWVMQRLQERGYEVVPQLGVAGYFIDLAVRHPDRNGSYILGIECDGAMYHSARSVRDRDRLRQEVLERLRWRIYRIWSTDWFRNPKAEINKLVEAIEELRHLPKT